MASLGTGVTIGSRTIRVLEVRKQKSGAWQVVKALITPLDDPAASDAHRVSEAKAALETAGVKGRALVGLSGKDLIIRYTQVPPVPDWRLEMLMNFEIQEVSEQSGGDVSAAYAPLAIDDATSGDNVVLVALAKNGHLTPRLDALRAAHLDVLGGCPRSVAAFGSYKENGSLSPDETVFLMHIGHENTDVAIARKGVLIFARNVAGGSKLFSDALVQAIRLDPATAEKSKITKGNITPRGKAKYRDSAEEKIANALMGVGGHFVSAFNSSLMFAKAQTKVPECQPSKLVLMGSGALLKGLPEYLESSLGLPVELFDPVASLDLSLLPEKTAEALRQDQGGMAVTLGLAQMAADDTAFRVEVLPASDKKKRRFLQQTAFSIAAAAVLLGGLVAAWFMLSSASHHATEEKDFIQAKDVAYGKAESEMESQRKRVQGDVAEMKDLVRLTALGPRYQQYTDLVQSLINDAKDENGIQGFDEIHVTGVKAKFIRVANPLGEDQRIQAVPAVDFDAVARSVPSTRKPADAYFTFQNKLNALQEQLKTIKVTVGQRSEQEGTFHFQIRAKSPSELEDDAKKTAAQESK